MRLAKFFILALALATLLASFAMAQDKPKATIVGPEKCKMCHAAEYKAWSATKHANAFGALKPEEQAKPECVGCHTTGKTAEGVAVNNVTCENCHGAGSEYKKPTIMSAAKFKADKAAQMKLATEAGLVMPTEATCKNCHKPEGNANFKERDFKALLAQVHPVAPKPAEAPAGK